MHRGARSRLRGAVEGSHARGLGIAASAASWVSVLVQWAVRKLLSGQRNVTGSKIYRGRSSTICLLSTSESCVNKASKEIDIANYHVDCVRVPFVRFKRRFSTVPFVK